jgi:hypothetical protein
MEYLLTPSEGDLPDLDPSVGDDEQAATRFTLFEECLSHADTPLRAPRGQLP